jgi:hypothetical protein
MTRSILDVPSGGMLLPLEWTAAADAVLALVHQSDGLVQLVLARTNGVDRHVVRSFKGAVPRRATLSPDGRFVAFDFPANGRDGQRDIMVVDTASGGEPRVLVTAPSNEDYPLWSTDGARLLFSSDRRGEIGTWCVPVSDAGVTNGEARRVARGTAGTLPIGITAAGDLYYHYPIRRHHLQLAVLDGTGQLSDPQTTLNPPAAVDVSQPVWSPDGSQLALAARRGWSIFNASPSLLLFDPYTSRFREVEPGLAFFGVAEMKWSPTGRALLIRGKGSDGYWGYYSVDPENGTATPLLRGEPRGSEDRLGSAVDWGFDGHTIVLSRPAQGIFEFDPMSGTERRIIVVAEGDWISGMGVDQKAQRVGFSRWNSESRASGLYMWSPNAGVTPLLEQENQGPVAFKAWLPGGRLLYAFGAPNGRRLGILDLSTGARIDSGPALWLQARSSVSAHPDGRTIAYATGEAGWEVRMLRGALR